MDFILAERTQTQFALSAPFGDVQQAPSGSKIGVMAGSIDAQIEALEAKLKQAKARRSKQLAAERAKVAKAARAEDTRRKVLLGAFVLNQLSNDPARAAGFELGGKRFMDWLIRADEKALFGLPEEKEKP